MGGKNPGKPQRAPRGGGGETEDSEKPFHSKQYEQEYLDSLLNAKERPTWDEFKEQQRKKGEMEGDMAKLEEEASLRFRKELNEARAARLSHGTNRTAEEAGAGKKKKKDKHKKKKRERSDDDDSSSEDDEAERKKRKKDKKERKKEKKEKKEKHKKKKRRKDSDSDSSSDDDEGHTSKKAEGAVSLSSFFAAGDDSD